MISKIYKLKQAKLRKEKDMFYSKCFLKFFFFLGLSATLGLFTINVAQAKRQSRVKCVLAEVGVLFGSSDHSRASIDEMVETLKRDQGVTVEYGLPQPNDIALRDDGGLGQIGIKGQHNSEEQKISLLKKGKNVNTKAILIHERVHSTTDHELRVSPSVSNCARAVQFSGALWDAPPGYRNYFRVDEILAFDEEGQYSKQVSNDQSFARLRRMLMRKKSKSDLETAGLFKQGSLAILEKINNWIIEYEKTQPEKYPVTQIPVKTFPGIIMVKMKFNPEPNTVINVTIPIPVSTDELVVGLPKDEAYKRAHQVLNEARLWIQSYSIDSP